MSLFRPTWRDEFLAGGQAALAKTGRTKNGEDKKLVQLEKQLAERDQVIGELTIANRVLKKTSGNFD